MLRSLAILTCSTLPLAPLAWAAEPVIVRDASAVTVTLDGGVALTFAIDGDRLLGLSRAQVAGVDLKSPTTAIRPFIAQEFPQIHPQGPVIGNMLRLAAVRADGDAVALDIDVVGTRRPEARWDWFVAGADLAAADAKPDAAMLALQPAVADAEKTIAAAIERHPEVVKLLAEIAKETQAATDPDAKKANEAKKRKEKAERALPGLRAKVRPAVMKDPAQAAAVAVLERMRTVRNAHGMTFAQIQRDYYRFAHLRLPSESTTLDILRKTAVTADIPMGRITWRCAPATRTVAGWVWGGWTSTYAVELLPGMDIHAVRTIGTWELGGKPEGVTLIQPRYRGIGGFAPTFTAAKDGGIANCYTTTEIIPGAVDGVPVISPAVPVTMDINDRGYGLLHRAGAWICRPARGAGSPLIDVQARPTALFARIPERQGNLRALTEAFPGDRTISQTDEELFALGRSCATVPMHHLVLVPAKPFTVAQIRTRWLEMDQDSRDRVSAELGFIAEEAQPAVGANIDNAWAANVGSIAKRIDGWAAMGVKQVYVHHPGWINGRAVRSNAAAAAGDDGKPPAFVGGGDCAIYDYTPMADTKAAWREISTKAAKHQIAYFVWLTGMVQRGGAFHQRVGEDLANWAVNAPGDKLSSGYPPDLFNFNIHRPAAHRELLTTLDRARREVGYQGFWADSFQNLFMSTTDWAQGTGAPMQRAWWEQLATWSKDGVYWCSESQSVPGLSCSMEGDDVDRSGTHFALVHTARWYRTDFPGLGTPKADTHAFRVMAHKAWAAPQVGYDKQPEASVPSFARHAKEYNLAFPSMRRGWILDDDRGTLWLPYDGDGAGCWFSFLDQPVPAGVVARPIGEDAAVTTVAAERVYAVTAKDLLVAFALPRGPVADERIGRTWKPVVHRWMVQR